jgi:hypothetical protein
MTKALPLTEKQIHFFEVWGLPLPPSFGYAHGMISYMYGYPTLDTYVPDGRGKPKKKLVLRKLDAFWEFYSKWVDRTVEVMVRDKEQTIVKNAFRAVPGVVVGVVARPLREFQILRKRFGYQVTSFKLQVLLEGNPKPKILGVSKITRVTYDGVTMSLQEYYDVYKYAHERSPNEWTLMYKRSGRILKEHLKRAKR